MRHQDVGDDKIGQVTAGQIKRFDAIYGGRDLVTAGPEYQFDQLSGGRIVVDNENSHAYTAFRPSHGRRTERTAHLRF